MQENATFNWQNAPSSVLKSTFSFLRRWTCDFYGEDSRMDRDGPTDSTDPRDIWHSRFSSGDLSDRRANLIPVSLVCKRWNEVANEMLYEEIDCKNRDSDEVEAASSRPSSPMDVDGESGEYYDRDEHPMTRRLANTLSSSPRLGLHVRRLILMTYYHDLETTKDHIKILESCPLVEDVKIGGYHHTLTDDYCRVLASLSHLRTLQITMYCLCDSMGGPLVAGPDLEKMMDGWPKLERLLIPVAVLGESRDEITRKAKLRGCDIEFETEW